MYEAKSDLLNAMLRRGDFHEANDFPALDKKSATEQVIGYIGFDATAPSLHVGNLMQLLKLRIMQQTGHKPIVLLGGGTTKIGDPSGKDEMRQIRDEDEINKNISRIKNVLTQFLAFGDGDSDAILVNNADWLDSIQYIPFLRDIGKHFTINRMLTFDSVKTRLDRAQPLSFIEFNYMLLQAFDFLQLNRRFNCTLQMGGSDQWGNILSGIDLCRRIDGTKVYGLTSELLTNASGSKMGKTADGAVWLSSDMLSPYHYWQFWRNTDDDDVIRYLRIFTDVSDDEISRLNALSGSDLNEAKKILATEATAMCHGRSMAEEVAQTSHETFEAGGIGTSLPTIKVTKEELSVGISAFDLFRRAFQLESSSESRRLMRGGAARINGKKIIEETQLITLTDLNSDGTIMLSSGKKKHALVKPS